MNKTDARKQLDELDKKAEEIKQQAAELRRIIEAPEWKPEDLVGKLCYVWDEGPGPGYIRRISAYNQEYHFLTGDNTFWHAEPVPAAEVEKMIYRKSRYDWSKAPEWARYGAPDLTMPGEMYWWAEYPNMRDAAYHDVERRPQ